MNSFINSLSNLGYTENGALTFTSTGNSVLDLFSMGGALRSRDEADIKNLVRKAINDEPLLAVKCIFYLRDIRSGQGERRFFRIALKVLEEEFSSIFEKNIENVPEYGRWDDLFETIGNKEVYSFIYKQFYLDIKNLEDGKAVSLLAKWLPSLNASSKSTRKLALQFCSYLGVSKEFYRKSLSSLRKEISIVESKMSAKEWGVIEYDKLPSIAGMKYRKAFIRHDQERYADFIEAVNNGEKTINASVLYPSDIVKKLRIGKEDSTLEAMWKNLPNYILEGEQALVVCDTSESMTWGNQSTLPIDVARALTIYYAERNTHPEWKDYYITFSSHPELVKLKGKTLYDKIRNFRVIVENTNIQAVFNLILTRAKASNLKQEDMPKKLYIVSDMEFDSAVEGSTNFEVIKQKYEASGYTMPKVIFWNVSARNDNCPVTEREDGVALVSGYSPSIFKNLLGDKDMSPISIMLDVLNSERYNKIAI